MSETDITPATSKRVIETEFLRDFEERVESVEFVRRDESLEIRTIYRLRRKEASAHA